MENCEKSKIKGTVNNSNLLKPGELRIKLNPGTGSDHSSSMTLIPISGKTITLTVIEGNGRFGGVNNALTVRSTDSNWNAGLKWNTDSPEPTVISVPDKYSMKTLRVSLSDTNYNDASNLSYCINLTSYLQGFNWSLLDLNNFKNKANVTYFTVSAVKGPLNINTVTGYSSLVMFDATALDVSGDINTIESNMPSIQYLYLGGTVTGNAATFATDSSKSTAIFKNGYLGEGGQLRTTLSWPTTTSRPATAKFMQLLYVTLPVVNGVNYLDNMLINQANLESGSYASAVGADAATGLYVYGTLGTSQEVTNAIATIKSKGISVYINGVKK